MPVELQEAWISTEVSMVEQACEAAESLIKSFEAKERKEFIDIHSFHRLHTLKILWKTSID